jgi:hypothetical protein
MTEKVCTWNIITVFSLPVIPFHEDSPHIIFVIGHCAPWHDVSTATTNHATEITGEDEMHAY